MNATAPPAEATAQDLEHLRLLSIFHYIVGAITALFSLLPVLHLVVGLLLMTGRIDEPDPAARLIGGLFVAIAAAFIVCGLILAGFMIHAGRCIARRRRHTLCLVVAGVECTLMPFGTVLGVFTLVALLKPQIRALFAER
jgi:fumarate reductase subunit D